MQNLKSNENKSVFLSLLDNNTIRNIFIELVQNYIKESRILENQNSEDRSNNKDIEDVEDDFKSIFENCLSFSFTCKIFYEISKNTKFEFNIFQNQKIQNISYLIYLKLNYIKEKVLKQTTFKPYESKEELLNDMLIFSSKNGFYDIIKPLIFNGASRTSSVGEISKSSLHCSCEYGYLKTSKKLLKYGSDINHQTCLQETPLHNACGTNNLNLIQYLVENGANLNIQNMDGFTPLFKACLNGNIDIVKYLINQGSNINHQNKAQQTILFSACRSKNEELIQYLINLGLNIDHLDNFQGNCIYYTCVDQDLETTKYLISKGADLNIKYVYGQTLLEILKNQNPQNFELIKQIEKKNNFWEFLGFSVPKFF